MEKAVNGSSKVLAFRLVEERKSKKGAMLALQVTHNVKKETSTESTQTKDGNVNSTTKPAVSIEIEALKSETEIVNMLEYAVDNAKEVEVWEIDVDAPIANKPNKYAARYGVGLMEGWEAGNQVGTNSTIKTTLKVNGGLNPMKEGATLDALQAETAKAFVYDTVAGATKEETGNLYTPNTTTPPEA